MQYDASLSQRNKKSNKILSQFLFRFNTPQKATGHSFFLRTYIFLCNYTWELVYWERLNFYSAIILLFQIIRHS